ncbi:hypothetical protein L6164_002552 [Bauhinia variegata]|uniref:Uncharacterized protein n=1 Tax=Bauhinia variegata TaxID=167791 RepID=A0ACB9PYK9_BAUVA|nr:hypothetical protein L6164_002552 [Bauhinia variegata]
MRIYFSFNHFLAALQMANKEDSSGGNPQSIEFTLRAMQQQFERFYSVVGDIRDRLDRQQDMIENLQKDHLNRGHNPSRHHKRDHGDNNDVNSENELGSEVGVYESEFEVGRNRHRRARS